MLFAVSVFFVGIFFFFFSSRRRHTRLTCDWSSDVCSSDLPRASSPRARRSSHDVAPPCCCKFILNLGDFWRLPAVGEETSDRKSTRLNSSHMSISYAVFCLKKKKQQETCLCSSTSTHQRRW